MNIAESMKHVLKSKGQNIFNDFWKEDLASVLKEFLKDLSHLTKSSGSWFEALKDRGFKSSLEEIKESAVDTFLIFKIIPRRIKSAFILFKEDMLVELDKLSDQKQKTIFCLKVIGALSGFTLNALYGLKKSNTDFKFKGLRLKNAFTQFIVMELVLRITKVFVSRFLAEVEKELTEEDDLKNIKYFKNLMSDNSKLEEMEKVELEPSDRALQIVENLRNYILTGKKIGE